MYEGTSGEEPRMTIEESYSYSTAASNLRVEADRRGAADVIIAAGMNPHELGMALDRLRAEWDRTAKPPPPPADKIEALAATLATEPKRIHTGRVDDKGAPVLEVNPTGGLVREILRLDDGEEVVLYRTPLAVAREVAQTWQEQDNKLALQRLKTLPAVRAMLLRWCKDQGFEDGPHLTAAVLLWWLAPKCQTCGGTALKPREQGNRRLEKPCTDCRANPIPGERKVPHGWRGRRMVTLLNECQRNANRSLDAKFRPPRKPKKNVDPESG